jgi:hypothetical protein
MIRWGVLVMAAESIGGGMKRWLYWPHHRAKSPQRPDRMRRRFCNEPLARVRAVKGSVRKQGSYLNAES